MNKPKQFKLGNLDALLNCGYMHNRWIETALKYLPADLLDKKAKGFLFTSTARRDACRIARHYCETREIILISERVLPGQDVNSEADPKARYLIYVVLHEMAHAIKDHKSQQIDGLSVYENELQEKEADDLAMKWFNDYIAQRGDELLKPINREEVKEAQEKSQLAMKKLKAGI